MSRGAGDAWRYAEQSSIHRCLRRATSKIPLKLVFAVLTLIICLGVARFWFYRYSKRPFLASIPRVESEQSDEYAVYSALIRQSFLEDGVKLLVIQDHTLFYANPDYLKSTDVGYGDSFEVSLWLFPGGQPPRYVPDYKPDTNLTFIEDCEMMMTLDRRRKGHPSPGAANKRLQRTRLKRALHE